MKTFTETLKESIIETDEEIDLSSTLSELETDQITSLANELFDKIDSLLSSNEMLPEDFEEKQLDAIMLIDDLVSTRYNKILEDSEDTDDED